LYARGFDNQNYFNKTSYTSATTYTNWTLAFEPVYSYLGQNRTIVEVITSPEEDNYVIAVLDSAAALWIAGNNQFGVLANGTVISTSSKSVNKFEGTPVLTDVKEAVMVGSYNGSSHPNTIAAIQWTNVGQTAAVVRVAGYGGLGQMGDGTSTNPNSSWRTVTLPTGFNPATSTLYSSGSDAFTSYYIVSSSGDIAYGWGYNDDFTLGVAPKQQRVSLPIKVWDATILGPPAQRGRFIQKLYTTSNKPGDGATYILTQPLGTPAKREIWAAGRNYNNKFGDAINGSTPSPWRNITPTTKPAEWFIEDYYVGHSWNQDSNNFIKWKIDNPDTDTYQLEASGWSGNYNTGTGLNSTPLPSFTRVNLRSSIVQSIVDLQNGRSHGRGFSYTYLLCDDGTLYLSGVFTANGAVIRPANFIRIK